MKAWIQIFIFSLVSFHVHADDSFQNFKLSGGQTDNLRVLNLTPANDELSGLYREILDNLTHYQSIGQQQVDNVLRRENGLHLLGLNNIGFSYNKEFAHFSVIAKRTLSPDLYHNERWIVHDEFIINIDASKFLSNLSEDNIIDITEEQLGAFAGLQFRRVYKYFHMADSYQDALGSDFRKLFLSFTWFQGNNFLDINSNEFLQREDYLTFNAGGIFTAPLGHGFSSSIGTLAKYSKIAKVDIHSPSEAEKSYENEQLRVNYEKTVSKFFGLQASLQIDFLKIIKLTLLSYDLNYQYDESDKVYLSFDKETVDSMKGGGEGVLRGALKRVVGTKGADLNILRNYIVSNERRIKEIKKSKYMALILGGIKDQKTEYVNIKTGNNIKTFFKHAFSKVKFTQNIFSRIVSIVFKSIFKVNSIVNHNESDKKTLNMEYESDVNLVAKKEVLDLDDKYKLSVSFKSEYYAGNLKRKRKKRAMEILDHHSGVDPMALDLFRNGTLGAPLTVSTRYQFNKDALDYFHAQKLNDIYDNIKELCYTARSGLFSKLKGYYCKWRLQREWDKYYTELTQDPITAKSARECRSSRRGPFSRFRRIRTMNCVKKVTAKSRERVEKEIPLWKLKDFLGKFQGYSKTKIDMYNFFGMGNIFFFGTFEATFAENDIPFVTYFREGEFEDLGVIDHHKNVAAREVRAPASDL